MKKRASKGVILSASEESSSSAACGHRAGFFASLLMNWAGVPTVPGGSDVRMHRLRDSRLDCAANAAAPGDRVHSPRQLEFIDVLHATSRSDCFGISE